MAIITPPPRPNTDSPLLTALHQESEGWSKGAKKARAEGKPLDSVTCNQTANLLDRSISEIETLLKYAKDLERVIDLQNDQSSSVRQALLFYLQAEITVLAERMKTDTSEGLAGEAIGLQKAYDIVTNDSHLKKDV